MTLVQQTAPKETRSCINLTLKPSPRTTNTLTRKLQLISRQDSNRSRLLSTVIDSRNLYTQFDCLVSLSLCLSFSVVPFVSCCVGIFKCTSTTDGTDSARFVAVHDNILQSLFHAWKGCHFVPYIVFTFCWICFLKVMYLRHNEC
jgi:hypothetical protein